MRRSKFGSIAVSFGWLIASASGQLGVNLVSNPSFEQYSLSAAGNVNIEGASGPGVLAGWISEGTLELDRYNGAFPPTTGRPPGGGDYLLFGSFTASSEVAQSIDVQFASTQIVAGAVTYRLSAYLGSWKESGVIPSLTPQDDIATLNLRWLNSEGADIGGVRIVGPNYPQEVGAPARSGNFQGFFATSGPVPTTAASARIVVSLVRDVNALMNQFNNANVDLVKLVLTDQPCASPFSGDFNDSGTISVQDIFDFLAAWFASEAAANINGIGGVTVQDIFDFLAAWFGGCV